MNKNKIIIIIFVSLLAVMGIYLAQSQKKGLRPSDIPTTTRSNEGSSVVTEGAKKEMQESSYTSGISLKITHPQPNAIITNSSLTVKGKTTPNAEVFINDEELKANASGDFAATIILDEGENPIIVAVNDDEGNSAEQQLLVTYQQ